MNNSAFNISRSEGVNQDPRNLGFEGTIAAGSYNPENGTVDVYMGVFVADFDDNGDGNAASPITAQLDTSMIGDQHGPQGGERVVVTPSYGGWQAALQHGSDDSPMVPVNERHILHPKMGTLGAGNTPVWDTGVKFTNDAAEDGDGLGGAFLGNNGFVTQSQTASGAKHTIDDTKQSITTTTAGGMTGTYSDPEQTITHSPTSDLSVLSRLNAIEKTIQHIAGPEIFALIDAEAQRITHQASPLTISIVDAAANVITHQGAPGVKTIVDGAGEAISHVVPSGGGIGLGAVFTDLAPNTGAINMSILKSFGSNINSANLQSLVNLGEAMVTAGIPNASSLIPLIVASLIQNVETPPGSSVVRIAGSAPT